MEPHWYESLAHAAERHRGSAGRPCDAGSRPVRCRSSPVGGASSASAPRYVDAMLRPVLLS